ncbi:MAG TPA: MarR family transcriptional regulator [Rudaea sp.]|jgi:DNA-binding MarR family transcriptional regulator
MKRQTECVCVNLRRAARAVTALYDDALSASGIKITQFSLLRSVQRNEPVSVSALSEDLNLDRTTLARNLDPLQRDGLIALAAGSDRRVTEVRLTAKGRKAIARALPLWQQAQQAIGRRFAPGRLAQLREIAGEATAVAGALVAAPAAPAHAQRVRR